MGNSFDQINRWLSYPYVVGAFKWRERQEWRRIVPRRWLSPAQVIVADLQLFEPQTTFDQKFIDDFAKARDDIISLTKKQVIFTLLVSMFLLSNYLEIGLDISAGGFSLRYSRGVPEVLLLISNAIACYTLLLQGNYSALDATIKFAINAATPEELRSIYLIRYFPHEQFGRYQPFNLPFLIPARLQRAIVKCVAILSLAIGCLSIVAFGACNLFLLFHYLWVKPSFGIWSNLLLVYILLLGAGALLYLTLTRFRLPYDDYIVNSELELLQKVNPTLHRIRLQELYGKLNEDRKNLELRGYLKPRSQPNGPS